MYHGIERDIRQPWMRLDRTAEVESWNLTYPTQAPVLALSA